MPAVAKDGMRGLAVFISDIRNCKSKEAETKRINKVIRDLKTPETVNRLSIPGLRPEKVLRNDSV